MWVPPVRGVSRYLLGRDLSSWGILQSSFSGAGPEPDETNGIQRNRKGDDGKRYWSEEVCLTLLQEKEDLTFEPLFGFVNAQHSLMQVLWTGLSASLYSEGTQ